ncbi:MAG: protein-glutamate O-methyltransferase [Alphaproteobacteria bacterium]|nr:protein-glutamate O-methyltransferase [Alphaproteobacteria bacterium]
MKKEDFDLFADMVKKRSGLVLTSEKAYLLESRLMPVARKLGLKDLEELAASLRSKRDEKVMEAITEAMTTNETFFFRDQKPFDQFRQVVLPHMLKVRAAKKSLRIWSAASSTGQEAYSLAMILSEEAHKMPGWHIEIIGTDISQEVVDKAKAGLYNQFEVQRGLPVTMLVKYFQQKEDKWQISDKIKGMVQYRVMNLLEDWGPIGLFDIIFCRNVLIYFDQSTKAKLLERQSQVLAPDGALFLGGAESVLGICDKFKSVESQRGIYIPTVCPAELWKAA